MRRILTFILALGLMSTAFQSCVYEEPVVVVATPDADVFFDFWAGPRSVEIDGEIFNDGSTFIRAVELEVRLFDDFGRLITTDFIVVDVFLDPRETGFFSLDFNRRYVFDVDIIVRNIFI